MTIAKIEFSGNINSRNSNQTLDLMEYAANSGRIKAVIIVINSGGGDATNSEKLAEGVKKLRTKKPVYAVLEGLGTSGAYWMASPANKIYSLSTTIVGSIGIIGINPNVEGLMEKLGIKVDIMKMGEYKDMITPFSEITDNARTKYMQILENSYAIFKNAVSENRKLSAENLELSSTGEIFSANKALELGLIDKIGSFDDALNDISKTYGVSPRTRALEPHRAFFEKMMMSNSVQSILFRILGL